MKVVEYGKENKKVVVLLHGGGLSWWSYRKVAELLKDSYRVVLPVLDGHSGSDVGFTSIEDNASRIIKLIEDEFSGHVYAIGGLSLGGQIALQILSMRPSISDYAAIESASIIPSKITNALTKPMLAMSYGLVKQRWFSKHQFKELKMDEVLFEEYYADTSKITKKDMIAFLKSSTSYVIPENMEKIEAKVSIIVGELEQRKMIESAKILNSKIPNSFLSIKAGLYHGEFSINYPEKYVSEFCK